jgi:P4 family phage/plasmid primase-like protien
MTWKSAEGNIGLRLHPNLLGIDVDMYDGKAGRATFNAAIDAWGPLPHTWFASSRADGSGIRLFRIPEGLAWPGKLPQGGGVELIRWDHRYVICAPSIHPDTGDPYLWYHSERGLIDDEVPALDGIPFLPQTWIDGLTAGREWTERRASDLDDAGVREWISARNDGKPCSSMQRTLNAAKRTVRVAGDEGGAHDAARDGAWGLIGDAQAGHAGLGSALAALKKVFISNVAPRRGVDGERLAKEEWARIVIRGVQKVAAEGEPDPDDMCALLAGKAEAAETGEPALQGNLWDFKRTDGGNADRLIHARRHEMLYCPALGGWQIWNGSRWVFDLEDTVVTQWAEEVVARMDSEASEIDDPKQFAAFKKFINASGNAGKLRSMIDLAAKRRGILVPGSDFDARPEYLGVGNGLVRLMDSGDVSLVPAQPEHRLTRSTGVDYVATAQSSLWNEFLKRVQPDVDVRTWLQKLVGYSLLGANPERLFIVAFGPTSTGKTTFMEALRSALGDYGGPMNLTVLRDNQDERARADLVEALDKRFLYAEEASHEWKLHPDQIKRVTGGTMLKARRPFAKEYIEKVPQFTPWLVTNSAPHIEGADPAFMRRLMVVPFDQTIPKEDEVSGYRARLCSEAQAAVLAWAVAGWTMYRRDPDLTTPASAFTTRAEFQDELSDFDSMLADMCDASPELREKPVALFQAYIRWCEAFGVRSQDRLSGTAFGRALSSRGYRKTSTRVDGKPIPCRAGLRLNEAYRSIVPEAFR